MSLPHLHLQADALYPFDARGIAKRFRHAAIFGALDALQPGETMRFVNDHDPLPLLAQLQQRYADSVAICYVTREPGQIVIDFKQPDMLKKFMTERGRILPRRLSGNCATHQRQLATAIKRARAMLLVR